MRHEVEEAVIAALAFYGRRQNYEIREEACPLTGAMTPKPSMMFFDKGEIARSVLSLLGIAEH